MTQVTSQFKADVQAEAERGANQAEAQRVRDLAAALGGRTQLLNRAIANGLNVTAAKAELADVLVVERMALGAKLGTAEKENKATRAELESLMARGYSGMIAQQVEAGVKMHRARINAAKLFPEAHEAWLRTQQPR